MPEGSPSLLAKESTAGKKKLGLVCDDGVGDALVWGEEGDVGTKMRGEGEREKLKLTRVDHGVLHLVVGLALLVTGGVGLLVGASAVNGILSLLEKAFSLRHDGELFEFVGWVWC